MTNANNATNGPEGLISQATLARLLERSTRTVQRWQREFGLPHFKRGRRVHYRWADVLMALERTKVCRMGQPCGGNCAECERPQCAKQN